MRSLWLASAAIIISAGAACAQTSGASPAATATPGTAATPTAPGISPGNTGSSGTSGAAMAPGSMSSGDTSTGAMPAPTGAPQAATATQPGNSPGNMSPPPNNSSMAPGGSSSTGMSSSSSSSSTMVKPKHKHWAASSSHTWTSSGGTVRSYLESAKMDVRHHNKMAADDALSMAETRMLNRAEPSSSGSMVDSSPGITAVENARKAVAAGDMAQASSDIDMAMNGMHGGGGGGMGGGGGSDMSQNTSPSAYGDMGSGPSAKGATGNPNVASGSNADPSSHHVVGNGSSSLVGIPPTAGN